MMLSQHPSCIASISKQILGLDQLFEEQAALRPEIEGRLVHIINQNTSFQLEPARGGDLWRRDPDERGAKAVSCIDTDAHRTYGFDHDPLS
jgi:hypothetical protein